MTSDIRRAVVYVRVSTNGQKLDLQLDETKALVEASGWDLVATFQDVGVSGTKSHRPGLDALLAAARSRQFDVLVVWKADRLFRNAHDLFTMVTELSSLGIEFVSCTEPFDLSEATGRLLFQVRAAFAEFEREMTAERTAAGIRAARLRGKRHGRPCKQIDVDRARSLYGELQSFRAVAREMGVAVGTVHAVLTGKRKAERPELAG